MMLCIPILNAEPFAADLKRAIKTQSRQPDRVVLIDSESSDNGIRELSEVAHDIIRVDRSDFDHGGTRNIVFSEYKADYFLFLTQDALPTDNTAFEVLCSALDRGPEIGVAYGRQLPRTGAKACEAHARLFNYGTEPYIRSVNDASQYGAKTCFCSNSFSVYRREAIEEVGYFDEGLIVSEDQAAAARMLLAGWRVAYVPEARVQHSHEYSLSEEFARYFDQGVSHSRSPWLLQHFGGPGGEGLRYLRSEIEHCRKVAGISGVGGALTRNLVKWLGYRTGRLEKAIPRRVKARLTRNRGFWRDRERAYNERAVKSKELV